MTNILTKFCHCSLMQALTLVSLGGMLVTLPALAGDWVRVKTDADNNAYYVDVSTIEGRGRLRHFWSNIIYGQSNAEIVSGKEVGSVTFYIAVDCQNQIYQVLFERFLDADGQTIQDYNYGDDGRGGTPDSGSPEDASLKFVCSK